MRVSEMNDSEYRAYKAARRAKALRQKMLFRFCVALFSLGMVVGIIAITKNPVQAKDEHEYYKYFTTYFVQNNDNLEGLAMQYVDGIHYHTTKEYISEVASINNLGKISNLENGTMLIVPYYSTEYFE